MIMDFSINKEINVRLYTFKMTDSQDVKMGCQSLVGQLEPFLKSGCTVIFDCNELNCLIEDVKTHLFAPLIKILGQKLFNSRICYRHLDRAIQKQIYDMALIKE